MTDIAAVPHKQLERVVEHRRIRPRLVDYRRKQAVVRGAEPCLTVPHPVDVPRNRVDLAVMAEQAERLSALPGWSGVGREALVEDCERDCEGRVVQVGIKLGELVGCAERLVRDRSEGE
jgi:hypothetical protein